MIDNKPIPDLNIYCDTCDKIAPCIIDPLRKSEYHAFYLAEIVCGNCNTVINTLTSAYPGKMVFEKEESNEES